MRGAVPWLLGSLLLIGCGGGGGTGNQPLPPDGGRVEQGPRDAGYLPPPDDAREPVDRPAGTTSPDGAPAGDTAPPRRPLSRRR
jgi:hypothetical protein